MIGIFAFIDDLIGRKRIKGFKIEIGQLSRGIGMLMVMIIGYFYFGPVSILIALMIQPLNIADMQPGSACSTVIIMCLTNCFWNIGTYINHLLSCSDFTGSMYRIRTIGL